MRKKMTEQVVYGVHAVKALLNSKLRVVKQILVSQERQDQKIQAIISLASQNNIPLQTLPLQKMNQRYMAMNHQGIVAITESLPQFNESDLITLLSQSKKPALILILDGITDPHNLGACLRTADATGVDFVIIPKDKSASITPAVSKVACGAAETVPLVTVTNLARAMDIIKQEGVWIYGAASEATQSLYQLETHTSIALVMGAEGEGLRRLTRDHCDGLFSLPMRGTVESLNISVATGVALYEVLRQRN
jgi:23S rRNA (guanosine2251-2'-O)-methyltransferase